MYKHNCAHCTLNGILRKPMAPTCAIFLFRQLPVAQGRIQGWGHEGSAASMLTVPKSLMRSIRILHGCVCVLQTNLAQVKASNLKNMPVFEAQTTGMCKTFPNLLHRHVYTTFTDLSCCYVIEQGTYPGFIRHAPLEIHALLVDWLQPQKNQGSSCGQHIDTKTVLERI